VRDFSGAPVASTWFTVAEANSLAGADLAPGSPDIGATFNSSIDLGCFSGAPSGWYYGFDNSPPVGTLDFVPVLLHELAHGLGILTLVDLASGAKLSGLNDILMTFLEDHSTGLFYPAMTNAQRVAASINTGNLHWVGTNVATASALLSAGKVGTHVRMYAPNPQAPGSSVSHFDTAVTPNELMEPAYTGPNHLPGLAFQLLCDIGWGPCGTCGDGSVNEDGNQDARLRPRRRRARRPAPDPDANTDADGDGDADDDADRHANVDAHCDADADGHADADRDGNTDPDCDPDANGDAVEPHTDLDGYCDAAVDPACNTDAARNGGPRHRPRRQRRR
jgi:hypothetical protein